MIWWPIFIARNSSPLARLLLPSLLQAALFLMPMHGVPTVGLPQEAQPVNSARIQKLEDSLLAPCCYGEPVSRHRSEIAIQMRKEITEKVLSGQSDREILDYYKALYGERVLIEPDGKKKLVLYSLPILISAAGLGILLLFLQRWTKMETRSAAKGSADKIVDAKTAEMIRNATDDL